jgi:hypothetical protein
MRVTAPVTHKKFMENYTKQLTMVFISSAPAVIAFNADVIPGVDNRTSLAASSRLNC